MNNQPFRVEGNPPDWMAGLTDESRRGRAGRGWQDASRGIRQWTCGGPWSSAVANLYEVELARYPPVHTLS